MVPALDGHGVSPGPFSVVPGLVPGIHALPSLAEKDVDGRDKPGHDDAVWASLLTPLSREAAWIQAENA
jgi:hypothetical protein